MKYPGQLAGGTTVRAHKIDERTYTADAQAARSQVDGRIGITTGLASTGHGWTYEVMFKLSANGETHAWFNHEELDVLKQLADYNEDELEDRFIEAEQNALTWAKLGVRSAEHCATRWMNIAGELRAELARRQPAPTIVEGSE